MRIVLSLIFIITLNLIYWNKSDKPFLYTALIIELTPFDFHKNVGVNFPGHLVIVRWLSTRWRVAMYRSPTGNKAQHAACTSHGGQSR